MNERYTLASTARLNLDIVAAGVGVISQAPTAAILRVSDGKWFQAGDGTWQATIVENPMTQTDSVNLPGRYHFDFDQSLDTLAASSSYVAKLTNTGGNARLEYRDLVFGAMPSVASMALCSIQGTVISNQGDRLVNVPIKATLMPVFTGGSGRAVDNGRVALTYTDSNGDFDLQVVRGGVFRLEIDAVGYDRKIVVPNQASVLFTDL
jgi:hypothetical protein